MLLLKFSPLDGIRLSVDKVFRFPTSVTAVDIIVISLVSSLTSNVILSPAVSPIVSCTSVASIVLTVLPFRIFTFPKSSDCIGKVIFASVSAYHPHELFIEAYVRLIIAYLSICSDVIGTDGDL